MCGLVTTVSFEGRPPDPVRLARMSDVIHHRGPDDSGLATYGAVGFAFRRLSILDLSPAGHQPMETADGRLAVVFNGEIYNYIELKRELQALGRRFRSTSDTEVLLQAYDQWDMDFVNRLNGMWAFVIYDKRRQRLVASRDRFGVKPLYRWSDGRQLILASEIKAILASGLYTPEINWPIAGKFLHRGHLDEDHQTFFKGIDQLPAGSTLEVDLRGRMTERRFWSIAALPHDPPFDPIEAFRALFEDAVRVRMRSDVPVGVCLSGGVDSNAIISTMASLRGEAIGYPLQAFSYIPDEFSEASYIRASIARTGATLNELSTSPQELWDLLPTALWHYDEPVHASPALVGYQLMRLAKSRGVTVVLNGQGADEVNAGYHAYFRAYWSDLMRAGRWLRMVREVSAYSRGQGERRLPLLRDAANHWMRREISRLPGYAAVRTTRPDSTATDAWFGRDLLDRVPPRNVEVWSESLENILAHSIECRPLPIYLRVEDRNSMAHSVEVRLPFLDYRLVSLAFSLPADWKLRGPWNKYIVREAVKGIVAEPVRTRLDKMGFPTPSQRWFADAWYEPSRDVLGSRALRESGVCNVDAALQDLDRHRAGEIDVSRQLFHLVQFALWLENVQAWSRPAEPPDAMTPVAAMGGARG